MKLLRFYTFNCFPLHIDHLNKEDGTTKGNQKIISPFE